MQMQHALSTHCSKVRAAGPTDSENSSAEAGYWYEERKSVRNLEMCHPRCVMMATNGRNMLFF